MSGVKERPRSPKNRLSVGRRVNMERCFIGCLCLGELNSHSGIGTGEMPKLVFHSKLKLCACCRTEFKKPQSQ